MTARVALLALACSTAVLLADDPADLAETLADRVVRIHMAGPRLPRQWGTCTAFSVNQERGWGVTAEHCVSQPETGFAYDLVDDKRRPLTVLAHSYPLGYRTDDLALLKGEVFTEIKALTALTIVPAAGVTVYAMGFSMGVQPAFFTDAMVARSTERLFFIHLDEAMLPGMSGSPVVNADGLVVGVVSRGNYGYTAVTGSWHFQELYTKALADEAQP